MKLIQNMKQREIINFVILNNIIYILNYKLNLLYQSTKSNKSSNLTFSLLGGCTGQGILIIF